jgi:hypothetical protein
LGGRESKGLGADYLFEFEDKIDDETVGNRDGELLLNICFEMFVDDGDGLFI